MAHEDVQREETTKYVDHETAIKATVEEVADVAAIGDVAAQDAVA